MLVYQGTLQYSPQVPQVPGLLPAVEEGSSLLHPTVLASLVEGKNFLLIPNLATVELLGVLAGHMNQASDPAVAYAASVSGLVNLYFKGREKPRGQITEQVRKQFPLWLSQTSVVAPRKGFVPLY